MTETVNHGSRLRDNDQALDAGVPQSKQQDKPWTKEELTLRQGPVELAKAVIEQWKRDGCPKRDAEAIKYWKGIVSGYEPGTGC